MSETLLAGSQVAVVNPIHPGVGLEHQRLQNPLILDGFTWQHSLGAK